MGCFFTTVAARMRSFLLIFHVLLSLVVVIVVDGSSYSSSSSSNNYNAYHYDMTTPMFTPDGRLLQVEYASAAAENAAASTQTSQSSSPFPILIVRLQPHQQQRSQEEEQQQNGSENDEMVLFVTARPSSTTSRFVVLKDNNNNNNNNNKRNDVVVAMSGVWSDCWALLRILQREENKWTRTYGHHGGRGMATTAVVRSMVHTISSACQLHAFGGGIRPYGATLVLAGAHHRATTTTTTTDSNNLSSSIMEIYKTDPSGAIQTLLSSSSSSSSSSARDVPNFVALGGGPDQRRSITERFQRNYSIQHSNHQKLPPLPHTLLSAVETFLEGQKKTRKPHQKKKNRKDKEEEEERDPSGEDLTVEAVVLSSKHGAYRVNQQQIERLLLLKEKQGNQ